MATWVVDFINVVGSGKSPDCRQTIYPDVCIALTADYIMPKAASSIHSSAADADCEVSLFQQLLHIRISKLFYMVIKRWVVFGLWETSPRLSDFGNNSSKVKAGSHCKKFFVRSGCVTGFRVKILYYFFSIVPSKSYALISEPKTAVKIFY
jgi:hypothetical protein